MLEPRIGKRGNKLHLSYELTHRIHCSRIYPLPAPNGSTVVLYGHDTGIRLLWRGGRRPKDPAVDGSAPPKANGVGNSADVAMVDDDEPQQTHITDGDDMYEAQDEAQDPECPYPPFVSELNLDLETEVVNLAVPSAVPSAASNLPDLAKTHMIVALACADARVKVMTIPLAPPAPGTHEQYLEEGVTEIDLQGSKSVSRDLAVKVIASHDKSPPDSGERQNDRSDQKGHILIASIGSSLSIWKFPLSSNSISESPTSLRPSYQAPLSGIKISFQSSPRLDNLLLAEPSGSVRILSLETMTERPKSSDSGSAGAASFTAHGKWIVSYQTPFHAPEGSSTLLARRKKILSAAWVLGGRGILTLLEDGQWGIWDMSASSQTAGKSIQDFALHGYLATSSTSDTTANPSQKKNSGAKLAPMTPNTRKAKAENLFVGASKPDNAAAIGGISVKTTTTKAGQLDESVVLWYNDSMYSINSMQIFWQRSMSSAGSGDKSSFGGLYAPGLTRVTDINLMNENITSISQLAPKSTVPTSALGQMNVQNDLLVSAEHRYIILQHLRTQGLSREQLQSAADQDLSKDQRMLDAGEADLGGMNRILDGMAGEGRVRRVGFAP